MDLENFIVNPITLALIILGVVEFIKKFGVTGNKLLDHIDACRYHLRCDLQAVCPLPSQPGVHRCDLLWHRSRLGCQWYLFVCQ